MRCDACLDPPEYQPGDFIGIVYCNHDCQKLHWPTHKAHCRILTQLKKLFRVAHILKTALMTYREVLYDLDLRKIELRDGILWLHQNPVPTTTRMIRRPFPIDVTNNVDYKEAVLAYLQRTKAMSLLGRLTKKLLESRTDINTFTLVS